MKNDVVLAGVGGQGILTLSTLLGRAALNQGYHLKQSEVHGMAQRGGAVVSHFRFGDQPPASSLVPRGEARLILSLEPLETLRYLPWLNSEGWLVSAAEPVENITDYPHVEEVLTRIESTSNHLLVEAEKLAGEINFPRGANVALLGAGVHHLGLELSAVKTAIEEEFTGSGEAVVEKNLTLLERGNKLASEK